MEVAAVVALCVGSFAAGYIAAEQTAQGRADMLMRRYNDLRRRHYRACRRLAELGEVAHEVTGPEEQGQE